jgi:hypothetical protein
VFEIRQGVEIQLLGPDRLGASGGEIERGLENIEQGGITVVRGELGEFDRLFRRLHVGGLSFDILLRIHEPRVGFPDLILNLQAHVIA